MLPEAVPSDDRSEEPRELHALLLRAARMFRLGMEAEGSDCLLRIGDALEAWMTTAEPDDERHVQAVLADLVAAQERGDALRIADLAEYELLPRVSTGAR